MHWLLFFIVIYGIHDTDSAVRKGIPGLPPVGVWVDFPVQNEPVSEINLSKKWKIITPTSTRNDQRVFGTLSDEINGFRTDGWSRSNRKSTSNKFGSFEPSNKTKSLNVPKQNDRPHGEASPLPAGGMRNIHQNVNLRRVNFSSKGKQRPKKKGQKASRPIRAKCSKQYTVNAGDRYKYTYSKSPEDSFCVIIFQAGKKTSLTWEAPKLSLRDCEYEYLFLSDGVNEGMFCNQDNPGVVKNIPKVMMQYERNQDQKFPRSKLRSYVTGTASQTSGGTSSGGGSGGGTSGQGSNSEQFCPQSCGRAHSSAGANRIIGGAEASEQEYPWMVHIAFNYDFGSSQSLCGGSILNSRRVLTAAHCLEQSGLKSADVTVGEHSIKDNNEPNRQSYNTEKFIIHPNYESSSMQQHNDIALIGLKNDIRFSDTKIGPICLAPFKKYDEQNAIVTGWGTTAFQDTSTLQDKLHEVVVSVTPKDECVVNYLEHNYKVIDSQVCASGRGKDSCQGDSGGPLVLKIGQLWHQIGVVSYGIGCADSNFPGVYSSPGAFYTWISNNMNDGHC